MDLLRQGNKIAVCLFDVSGAFDNTYSNRLIQKRERKGLGSKMTRVIRSWLHLHGGLGGGPRPGALGEGLGQGPWGRALARGLGAGPWPGVGGEGLGQRPGGEGLGQGPWGRALARGLGGGPWSGVLGEGLGQGPWGRAWPWGLARGRALAKGLGGGLGQGPGVWPGGLGGRALPASPCASGFSRKDRPWQQNNR